MQRTGRKTTYNKLEQHKELKEIATKGWITVMTSKGLRAAGLSYGGGGFHIYGDYNLDDNGRSRGVFVKREGKKVKQ